MECGPLKLSDACGNTYKNRRSSALRWECQISNNGTMRV
jgi:hypothetical protein